MKKTTSFMLFIFGIAVGSAVTWNYTKKKYEQIAQEEIDSVKEVFERRKKARLAKVKVEHEESGAEYENYERKIEESGYTNYSGGKSEFTAPDKKDREYFVQAYVISPDEFGENDDYEEFSLTYYADQVLTDDNNDIIEDIEATVSYEALSHFGEYEDDSVFVRNDIRKCDYEILLDHRKYSDVVKNKPHYTED